MPKKEIDLQDGEKENEIKIKLIDVLKSYPEGLTLSDIVKQTGLSKEEVLNELKSLKEEGSIGSKKEKKDKTKIKLEDLLKSYKEGLTIAEIMKKTGLARHTVLARLHALRGEGKVAVRQINMAKLHLWKGKEKEEEKAIKDILGKNKVEIVPLKEEYIKEAPKRYEDKEKNGKKKAPLDIKEILKEVEEELRTGKIKKIEAKIKPERELIKRAIGDKLKEKPGRKKQRGSIETGVPGLDDLFTEGVPQGATVLVAGGAGAGKTILCLQILAYHASRGKKCLYMSFEESEENLIGHMDNFGWNPRQYIKEGNLKIQRFNPFDITRNVDALLAKQKGELLIDVDPILIPEDFRPDFIVVDSLTAIASAFTGKEENYRIYIEQLFRFFEKLESTSFLVTETEQVPKIFSQTGVEEFLADGVIVLYNIKHGNIRESAIEVLKIRGVEHQKKIVAMQITDNGIVVYPEQEVFEEF
ncbi:MAG TPA: ATPase domain-containing protein [Candidatus Nanoarchaeia archaeon]|nr:ATPase domain-containing protein [Candidatus Nanoarchaeia archaeon]